MTDLAGARLATPADLISTVEFALAAKEEVRDERGGRWLIDHDLPRNGEAEQHQRALDDASRCLAVGTVDGTVVGHALAYVSHAIDASICMIEELYVDPQARAIGVGSVMLETVRNWALAQGCVAIESHVLPGNREAKNFFERVGMVTRKMRVSTSLVD